MTGVRGRRFHPWILLVVLLAFGLRLYAIERQDIWGDEAFSIWLSSQPLPEVMAGGTVTIRALIREYLFVSLFRACAESLASENASRLAAMQRADKNIDELLEDLNRTFHRLRQSGIDEELFDVLSGVEALSKSVSGHPR